MCFPFMPFDGGPKSNYAPEIGPQEILYTQQNQTGGYTSPGPNGSSYFIDSSTGTAISMSGKRFEGLTAATAVCGVKIPAAAGGALFSKNDNTGFMMQRFTDNILYFRFAGVGNSASTAAGDLPLNVWTQAACIYDGTTMTIRINGISKATATHAGLSIPADGVGVKIGATQAGLTDNANFDYFYFYNRALSQNELNALAFDPFQMFRGSGIAFLQAFAGASSAGAFRKTLSHLGTRTGSRQVHRV